MDFSNVDLALGTLTAYDSGSSVSSGSLAYAVGTAVLSQSLDLTQQMEENGNYEKCNKL